ncbi:MAG: hypothetical protein GEV07_08700 [Streptosporangiales bacterium]|nr:hypothetical protein [Streptosporangiales bacterium]
MITDGACYREGCLLMSRFLRKLTAATGAAFLLTGLFALPAHAAEAPTAIVSLGDSYISGEAAGDYEEGTDQEGNFCHRSNRAEIHSTGIDVDESINLACSGATTDNVRLGGTPQNGEAPQAERLREVAKSHDVQLVVLSIGGNDVGFSDLVLDCIKAYFRLGERCQDKWADKLPAELEQAAPNIARSLADIRTVMNDAGYADGDYQLVLQSYPSPVTEKNRYTFTKAFEGCPIRDDDAQWARTRVVSQFAGTLSGVAADAGARFLDLSHAFYDREVCAEGIDHSQEWAKGVDIDVGQIQNGAGSNIVQQSMHPNELGHAQFGTCVGGFFGMSGSAGRCLRGPDGNLAAEPITTATVQQQERSDTVPRIAEPEPVSDKKRAYAKEAKQRLLDRIHGN